MSLRKAARRARVPLGTLIAIAFLLVARPTWTSLLVGLALIVPGLWLRAWAAGTLKKFEALATTGPYAYTRNPLYLGSALMAFGFAVAGGLWIVAIVLAASFYAFYRPTILDEEEHLRKEYRGFDEYARAVPRLIPRLSPARLGEAGGGFSRAVYVKNREYQALMGVGAAYAALIARILLAHPR